MVKFKNVLIIAITLIANVNLKALNPPEAVLGWINITGAMLVSIGGEETYTCNHNERGTPVSPYVWTVDASGSIVAGGGANDNYVKIKWNTAGANKSVKVTHNSSAVDGAGNPLPIFDGQTADLAVTVVKVESITPALQTVCIGTETEFKVETFPAGKYGMVNVAVAGATILSAYDTSTGKIKVKFDQASTSALEYRTVTATCGISSNVAQCIVFKVEIQAVGGLNPVKVIPATGVQQFKAVVTPTLSGTYVWFTGSIVINLISSGENVMVRAGAEASVTVDAEDLNVRFTPTSTMASCWDTRMLTVFTVDFKSVTFTSANSDLTNYDSNFGGGGGVVYNPKGWRKISTYEPGANNPITHEGGGDVTIDAAILVKPSGINVDICGAGAASGFSYFDSFNSMGSDQIIPMVSLDSLIASVGILDESIVWSVNAGGSSWVSVGVSGPHKVYVTKGTPSGSVPTKKRVEFVCVKAGGDWSPESCAASLWDAIASGTQFRPAGTLDGWEMLDWIDPWMGGGDCDNQSRCMSEALMMLGIPASVKKVYASIDAGAGNCLAYDTRNNCSVHPGSNEKLCLYFPPTTLSDGWNFYEGCCSAAGGFYAIFPKLNASDDYQMLKILGATQYWCRISSMGGMMPCTAGPVEIP